MRCDRKWLEAGRHRVSTDQPGGPLPGPDREASTPRRGSRRGAGLGQRAARRGDRGGDAQHGACGRRERGVKILLLAPHPFFQARGTPHRREAACWSSSARGDTRWTSSPIHEGADVDIPNCRIHRIPRLPGSGTSAPGFSIKKVVCDVVMFGDLPADGAANPLRPHPCGRGVGVHRRRDAAPGRRPLRLRHGFLTGGADGRGISRLSASSSPVCAGARRWRSAGVSAC